MTVTQALAADLAQRPYTVSFHVVSEDGHPVSDKTTFTVAVVPTATTTPSETSTHVFDATDVPDHRDPATAAPATPPPADERRRRGTGRALRIGLAVGVAALALAGGHRAGRRSRRRPRVIRRMIRGVSRFHPARFVLLRSLLARH